MTYSRKAAEAIHGSLRPSLDSGLTEGIVTVQDGERWIVCAWEQTGPQMLAVAIGDGPTADEAGHVAEERLADEVERQKAKA